MRSLADGGLASAIADPVIAFSRKYKFADLKRRIQSQTVWRGRGGEYKGDSKRRHRHSMEFGLKMLPVRQRRVFLRSVVDGRKFSLVLIHPRDSRCRPRSFEKEMGPRYLCNEKNRVPRLDGRISKAREGIGERVRPIRRKKAA